MYKSCNVVLLTTNQAQNEDNNTIYLNNFSKELILGWRNARSTNQTVQYLYITSDEEIEEGDWFIVDNTIRRADFKKQVGRYVMSIGNDTIHSFYKEGCKKIIATTDTSLRRMGADGIVDIALGLEISYIPESFIKYFIEEYNKGNVITKVMVEYVQVPNSVFIQVLEAPYIQLKINSDNTINTKPIKVGWSREEVIKLLKSMPNFFNNSIDKQIELRNQWIEENL